MWRQTVASRPNWAYSLFANYQYHAPQESQFQPIDSDQYPQDYPQGPQGDPFAPQPSIFFPPPVLDHPLPAAQKSMKRKRKQKKCDFCGGNDTRNKDGQPEVMLSCVDCDGPSGASILPVPSFLYL
ncbi:hypothetical protein GYMLUDRAFT_502271 [Collybiopsis luxurians FD-317 M1]|uniref:Uncharacterized protein n=1 Tax=Collybiopsis luxurians FD-317 M1 TaxID=944289 RepID=A0A0D0BFD1_9AGAR|nr:hypothetical protein GYMLUDRAFT_502271 [Collybiopsis luxurians FD-317 M1]